MNNEIEAEGADLTDNEIDSENDDHGEDEFGLEGVEQECDDNRVGNDKLVVVDGEKKKKWEPEIGMVFDNDEQAYRLYNEYARRIGFSVRKQHMTRNSSGQIWGRMFVCYREGFCRTNHVSKRARIDRSHERSGCKAHIGIKRLKDGKFILYRFVAQHNHELAPPHLVSKLRSQREDRSAMIIRNKGNTVKEKPRSVFDFLPSTVGGRCEMPFTHVSFSSSKVLKHEMRPGDAEAVISYLQRKAAEDRRFYSAMLLDSKDQLTNVFWRDSRSKVDFEHFGDVVCFDTTYRINDYGRPYASFYGVNHHKQIAVFGAAFLYDETVDTYKWLFKSFGEAFCGKVPQVLLTDDSDAISMAVKEVWPNTTHRLCVWQMYQNAMKQLKHVLQASPTFKNDISRCMYGCEDEEEFLSAWQAMLEKYHLRNNTWLSMLFQDRKKWGLVYHRETFYGDMKDIQINEHMNVVIRKHLHPDRDLVSFFRYYEKLVEDRRHNESEAEFHASQSIPGVRQTRLLKQAASTYTPKIYEMFSKEFQLYLDSMIEECGEVGTDKRFKITNVENGRTGYVVHDSSNGTLTCSCSKFEFLGILCWHVLKVLDHMNIKEIPEKYILKRWRKDAKAGLLLDLNDCSVEVDSNVSLSNRFKSLGRIYGQIMAKGAESSEAFEVAVQEAEAVLKRIDQTLQKRVRSISGPQPSAGQAQDLVASEELAIAIPFSGQPQDHVVNIDAHGINRGVGREAYLFAGPPREDDGARGFFGPQNLFARRRVDQGAVPNDNINPGRPSVGYPPVQASTSIPTMEECMVSNLPQRFYCVNNQLHQ